MFISSSPFAFYELQAEKGTIMKAVGVVESSPDTIFDMIMSLNKSLRYQYL
jgi:hypothetical protein